LCSGFPLTPPLRFCVFEDQPPDASSMQSMDFDNYKGTATVVSVEAVTGDTCQDHLSIVVPTEKIVLQLPQRLPLTVFLGLPNLPPEQLVPGDTVEVDIATSPAFQSLFEGPSQQMVLSRAGKVLAFAGLNGLANFTDYGITLQGGDPVCVPTACSFVSRSERVTAGGSQALLVPGQTAQVGTMSITLGRSHWWSSEGGCDGSSAFQVGGFDTTASPSGRDASAERPRDGSTSDAVGGG
jgi:hypothetical protein